MVTYTFRMGESYAFARPDFAFFQYYELHLKQGQEKTLTKWTQYYINNFLSDIGGLFTSLMAFANFLIAGY